MIDLKVLREDPERVEETVRARGMDVDVRRLVDVDAQLRETITELERFRSERNALKGPEARERGPVLKQQIADFEAKQRELEEQRDTLWASLPNLLAEDTPPGKDDADNVQLKTWGEIPKFDFEPKPHDTLGANLGVLDLQRAGRVSGSGYYYWTGDGARLAWGLFSYALDFLMERGFQMMMTPVLTREFTLFGTGYLPFFRDQIYKIEGEDAALIGTSEQTLVGYHTHEILPANSMPLLYTAFSPCFRSEAGSHGRASRGAFRVHQFHKVEQIVFCRPEESEEWHLKCLENEEELMQRLGIPYRVVRVCVGDLGAPAYKKYDIEGWFAGFASYRETHSNTNLLDYQTRRLKVRVKDAKGTYFPHTISATEITDRALLAIMENNQHEDGSFTVPEVLRKYVGGKERITKG